MDMIVCTRRLTFCAGHRVMGHENKCGHLHGHNYAVHVTARAVELDGVGRVVDFAVLKDVVGRWIEEHLDHGFILHKDDSEAAQALYAVRPSNGKGRQKLFLMDTNPTAENLALMILVRANQLLAERGIAIRIVKVVVEETENCSAEAAI